jgi:hypothetical protein
VTTPVSNRTAYRTSDLSHHIEQRIAQVAEPIGEVQEHIQTYAMNMRVQRVAEDLVNAINRAAGASAALFVLNTMLMLSQDEDRSLLGRLHHLREYATFRILQAEPFNEPRSEIERQDWRARYGEWISMVGYINRKLGELERGEIELQDDLAEIIQRHS